MQNKRPAALSGPRRGAAMDLDDVRGLVTMLLAYVHRYGYPLMVILLPARSGGGYCFWMGVGLLCLALYDLIGYLCRWKHLFCSYQNLYHQPMTPFDIDWDEVRKRDAYGVPAILSVIGIGAILCEYLL